MGQVPVGLRCTISTRVLGVEGQGADSPDIGIYRVRAGGTTDDVPGVSGNWGPRRLSRS